MDPKKITGLKKRQQIQNANKTMFIWVAVAAVALSITAVGLQYLYKQWTFNNSVIAAKSKANSTLQQNLKNAQPLKDSVNELLASNDLAALKKSSNATGLEVILDALPSANDVTALATSVQQSIAQPSGVSIESLSMASGGSEEDTATSTTSGPQEQRFSMVVAGNYGAIKSFTENLQRSIRPMKITEMNVSGSDQQLRATFEVVTYYQPAKSVEIQKKAIKQ